MLSCLDSLAAWRRAMVLGVGQLEALLDDTALLDAQAQAAAAGLRQRLASDRLVLAFVAEVSRGKSELINALFFADTGRRVLPATPGRTTMCPVELAWDDTQPASLALLPIATRRAGRTLAALRDQPQAWQTLPLPLGDADAMAQVLQRVTQTLRVPVAEARELGFWSDEVPEDNPPLDAEDQVELPAWRHALINYPHPLLKRGLVVLDTPGLNAIGAEPELTLSLLPSAHAAVFLVAADTGVSRSDLAVWRDHLGDRGCQRFVVLNKIDTLADPMLGAAQVQAQIQQQCDSVAATLGVAPARVFALSARQALAARVQQDPAALAASRLPALEQALLSQLLPQRAQVIGRMVEDGVLAVQQSALRRLADRQRQVAEQLFELRGLRGKSAARLRLTASRLAEEAASFERCAPRLAALRAVLSRQLQELLDGLSSDRVRDAVRRMRDGGNASLLKLGAGRAFDELSREMQVLLAQAGDRSAEIEQMLQAGARGLNADFGFSLEVPPRPSLAPCQRELARIADSHREHLSVLRLWRLAQPGFMEGFSRLLLARLRMVLEGLADELDRWARAIGTQIDDQLRERRRTLQQRREAHERIGSAEHELDRSIDELVARETQLQQLTERLAAEVDGLRGLAASPPVADDVDAAAAPWAGVERAPRLQLVGSASALGARGAA